MFDEYLRKMEFRLKKMEDEIGRLKAKAEKAQAGVKETYYERIGSLRDRQEQARGELRKLKEAGSEKYDEVRKGAERAFDDLRKEIDGIVDKIRKAA